MKKINLIALLLIITQTISFAKVLELSGTVISDNEKFMTSRFMGFVKSVNVDAGSMVKKGDLLYEIDSIEIDSKKQQATLAVQMYENQYLNVKRNYERYTRLYEKGLVSKFEVEQLELGANNLKNMVDISKLQLQEVNNQYQYLKIVAPNDGVVIKKMIKTGEMAMPGMPAIVLSDLTSLKINTEVAEGDLKDIKVGQKVNIEIPSIAYKTTGSISAIVPSSNPMTHKFTVKIKFKSSNKVYPGMYTKIVIK
jgi:RND family efflux transporter MFP subunit